MAELYRNIEVTCPVCQMVKEIKIPNLIFDQKRFGMVKIQVPQGSVCGDHQFIVFIDINGTIRGYEKIDLILKNLETTEKFALQGLIKLFGLYGLFSLLHAKIFNYNTLIICDTNIEVEPEIINQFGNQLLPENYRDTNSFNFSQEADYDKIKKVKDTLVIDNHQNILQTPWNKKLKFEEEIIKKALNVLHEDEQLVIIKKHIVQFVKEVEFVRQVIETKEIYEDDLIDMLSREYLVSNGSRYRIRLIKEFIERRISRKLAQRIKNIVEDFLKSL
jgi:hypothetical protein